jgi:hypothetical protein
MIISNLGSVERSSFISRPGIISRGSAHYKPTPSKFSNASSFGVRSIQTNSSVTRAAGVRRDYRRYSFLFLCTD